MKEPKKNKFGLTRYIETEVTYEIRKRSGFGCVICGIGIIEYEHVDPDFAEAKTHDPDCMTILCPTCHAKKTRKFLSTDTIKRAMTNPKCLQQGFSKEVLDIGNGSPTFIFAGSEFSNCRIPLIISGVNVIEFSPPETQGGPFRLSGNFFDSCGQKTLQIIDNEWQASTQNWDVEVTGGRIIVSESKNKIHLALKAIDANKIEVETLRTTIGNRRVEGDRNKISVFDVRKGTKIMELSQVIASNAMVGFSL